MKYLLINKKTGEETLCDKVTIDGFEYYVCDAVPYPNDTVHSSVTNTVVRFTDPRYFSEGTYKKVIATNNPIFDIPQVVDEVEEIVNYSESLAKSLYNTEAHRNESIKSLLSVACQSGYNKSQETHPFSYEDADAYADAVMGGCLLRAKEWKSQQPKKVYYEK
jgi:hypothetical protein